ncbi:hypothetical protein BGZ58_000872 [Dissophora ornata]|nr:hypothetical protein BGZ58_000872 [Dissophora ornata]
MTLVIGNAVGDAYGLATEFMSKGHARERYGNGPIEFGSDAGYPVYIDFHRSKWSRNDFTDDTDQMLLILQTLQQTQDGRLHAPLFAKRLKEWSIIGFPEMQTPPRGIGYTVGSTLSHPEFRYNPHKAAFDVWNARGRNLAANGAVMRTSVLGVESFWDEARVVENALAAAKVTHADPRSIVSALIASVLISRLLRGGGQSADEDASRTWNPKLEQESYKLELLEYLRRGSDMKGELTSDPAYEPETANATFKNKNGKGIANKMGFAAGIPAPYSATSNLNGKRPEVKLRDDIGWKGIDNVGEDGGMESLARSVVDDYKFLLLETDVVPATIRVIKAQGANTANDMEVNNEIPTPMPQRVQEKWTDELVASCFPKNLDDLKLGDAAGMGYTFKCIGIGYYAATKREDPAPTSDAYKGPAGLFRGVMEQVTLEAGDADTNGAVVGSLLGARLGVKEGIPNSWWTELKHFEWFSSTVDEYADRVIAMYEEQEQRRL